MIEWTDIIIALIWLVVAGLFFGFLGWVVVNMRNHTRIDGALKRGVPIHTSKLPAHLAALSGVSEGTHSFDWGWVRAEGNVLLVRADFNHPVLREERRRRPTPCPYVMLIDRDAGRISWRVPLGVVLLAFPNSLSMLLPVVLILLVLNHKLQVRGCIRALELLTDGAAPVSPANESHNSAGPVPGELELLSR